MIGIERFRLLNLSLFFKNDFAYFNLDWVLMMSMNIPYLYPHSLSFKHA